MKTIISFLLLFAITASAESGEIRFFNASVLGRSVNESIILVEENKSDKNTLIEPIIVQLDVKRNVYMASSVYYPAEQIYYQELLEQIEKKYGVKKYIGADSNSYAAYRIENEEFAISISDEVEEGMYRVIYMKFQ